MDVKQALQYPYRLGNLIPTVFIPGSFIFFSQLLSGILLFFLQGMHPELVKPFYYSIFAPLALLSNIFLGGFFWHLAGHFQKEGPEEPAPKWGKHWKSYFKDGMKVFVYLCILYFINMVCFLALKNFLPDRVPLEVNSTTYLFWLMTLTLLLTPLLVLPVLKSANQYSWQALFNWKDIPSLIGKTYGMELKATAWSLMVFTLYLGIIILMIWSIWGSFLTPFLLVAMLTSMWHLLNQGYVQAQTSVVSEPGY